MTEEPLFNSLKKESISFASTSRHPQHTEPTIQQVPATRLGKSSWAINVTISLHQVQSLRMHEPTPPLPLRAKCLNKHRDKFTAPYLYLHGSEVKPVDTGFAFHAQKS